MKTLNIIILLIIGLGQSSFAQDIIFRVNGTTIEAKITSASSTVVKYQKMDNLYGANYFIEKSRIIKIVYENGTTVWMDGKTEGDLNTETNDYTSVDEYSSPTKPKTDEPIKIKRHTIYGEILGMSGFFSVNYMPTVVSSPNGAFSIKARIGIGMSNKSIHFPHGILFGFGNVNHQFEIGFQGAVIAGLAEGDVFAFLHNQGKSTRYSFSPTFGYRFTSKKGFTFNVNMLMVSSNNKYPYSSSYTPSFGAFSGLCPWFGVGLGYAF